MVLWQDVTVIIYLIIYLFKGGLYLDLLGHGHSEDWTELGYLISGPDLDNTSLTLNPNVTSIRSLASSHPLEELLRGKESLGGLLEDEGITAVPSPGHRGPGGESMFYGFGSYNMHRHGSRDGGNVDGTQIAVARAFRTSDSRRPAYVKALAKAIIR